MFALLKGVAGKDTMWYQTGEQKTLRPQRSPMPQPIMVYEAHQRNLQRSACLALPIGSSVGLMRNRPMDEMGAEDQKQKLEGHVQSALLQLWCVMSFKERLLTARDWSTLCRGPIARSGSARESLISRVHCSYGFPPSVCLPPAVRQSRH